MKLTAVLTRAVRGAYKALNLETGITAQGETTLEPESFRSRVIAEARPV